MRTELARHRGAAQDDAISKTSDEWLQPRSRAKTGRTVRLRGQVGPTHAAIEEDKVVGVVQILGFAQYLRVHEEVSGRHISPPDCDSMAISERRHQ